MNAELIAQLNGVDEGPFGRLINLLCAWAEGTVFDFAYCDVVRDRLLEGYKLGPTRIACRIVLAALELAVSHNRWHVMNQVGAMLGPAAGNGLIDRILIEIGLGSQIERGLRRIEETVRWRREGWHPKLATFLNERDGAPGAQQVG